AFVRAICEDDYANIWFGTAGLGLLRYNNSTFSRLSQTEDLAQNTIRALYRAHDGRVWVGSFGGGILRIEYTRKGTPYLVPLYSTKNGLSSDYIFGIVQDRYHRLWIATRDGGINIIDTNARITTLRQKHGLPSNAVLYIARDASGTLWIGTQFGIALLHESDSVLQQYIASNPSAEVVLHKSIKILSARNGLPEDATRSMIQDQYGNYWLAALSGIYCISQQYIRDFLAGKRSTIDVVAYGKSDGMRSAECNGNNQPSSCLDSKGFLWFPTMKGVVRFAPTALQRNTIPPPVHIEEVLANDKPVAMPDSGNTLQLRAGTERITIRYTGLSLLFPNNVQFRYRLEGFDEDWIDAGNRREAYYTNLAPRLYVFHVQACNNDGVWNEIGAEIRIELQPRIYQTWWFLTLCGIALVLAVFGLFQWRLQRARERERELARLVDERTAEIQRQVKILDEQAREIEISNTELYHKNQLIEEERQKSDLLLLNILPPQIAERLKSGEKIIADKFDSATVMFADIVGFTKLSAQIPPEHLVENLSMIFTMFDRLAEQYGLEKIKTIGDAYMAVGGVPVPLEDHTAAVVRMSLAAIQHIQDLTAELDEQISIRIGVHTGAVVAGVIGMRKFAYDLWGDTVNTASRMEASGEANRIHCSEQVYYALKDRFEFEERGLIEIKGKGRMKTYFVLRERL
ncbi:MAG: adenylate/guanylate cyclase domain-containing protein, partial [Bacteroidota bacterium]|nr:adenylate/guanylate cyclase domain-containing protein [Bacteroidota bacterium]